MVKFIDHWMFASRLWNDAESTAVAINLREVQQIGQISVPSLGGDLVAIYIKNNIEPIPIDGNIIEILAEFQKHLNTIYI